ncbi:PREDICTED: uncharacterized protein LOC109474610 [Branchiostoma belcheri]|uniref:Uncharacterized protein LOC109474610 n=1 Tax=Branchiostoma belcheri TaxID=7741 RepID=A0A6P4Z9B9_BRABE|nr:PREDICTED: uncharacterized protein LOC109474610 [Branchiostoma belcheri]
MISEHFSPLITGTRSPTQDDIEITPGEFCSRGGVANGKELYRIGKDMKALQLARNKLLAEMSSLKETLQCPDQSGKTVSDKTRRRIQDTVQAYVTSLHIAANDVITTPAPPDPQQVTCHDEVATTGRNMFWAEDPKKVPLHLRHQDTRPDVPPTVRREKLPPQHDPDLHIPVGRQDFSEDRRPVAGESVPEVERNFNRDLAV